MNVTQTKVRLLSINLFHNFKIGDGKIFYLKRVREMATSGRFYDLINFLNISIPNVSLFYFNK
jgi:hypothetical protein